MEVLYFPVWTKLRWFIRRNRWLEHLEPGKHTNSSIKPNLSCVSGAVSSLAPLRWVKAY